MDHLYQILCLKKKIGFFKDHKILITFFFCRYLENIFFYKKAHLSPSFEILKKNTVLETPLFYAMYKDH